MTITAGLESDFPPGETKVRIVLVTVPDAEVGRALALAMVEARLAACGNVVPGLISVYRWKGGVHQDPECLVIFKTAAEKVPALEAAVVEEHPYDVPEFLVLPVLDGYRPYLDWVREEAE